MPYEIGILVAPYLHSSGLLEEFEHKAGQLQRDLDLLRDGKRVGNASILVGLDDIIMIRGLSSERMDFYPLRKAVRDVTLSTCDNLRHLHPRRQRLWTWYDVNFSSWDYVRCGHCERLVIAALGLPDSNYDLFDEYDEPFPGTLYDGTRVEDLWDWPFIDEAYEIGDEPPLCTWVTVNSLDDRFCWRFFISNCERCHYKVWPAPPGSQSHCLACYYFEHVLNELMDKL